MKINNCTIFQHVQNLSNFFEKENLYIPVKANFYIQKNIKTLLQAEKEIEQARLKIGQHYGELNEKQTEYIISAEKINEANKELNDLLLMEQDLDIKTFSLEALGDINLTSQQMQALMFMIED